MIGLAFISGAVIKSRDHAHALAEKAVLAGELKAEEIVIGSERAQCRRTALNQVADLNTWYAVDVADFAVGRDPHQPATTRAIRELEAERIDAHSNERAGRVIAAFGAKLESLKWRAASTRAALTCEGEYPLP